MHHFQIFRDKVGEYRVRFMWKSEVLFATDGYRSPREARHAVETIKKNAPNAEVSEVD